MNLALRLLSYALLFGLPTAGFAQTCSISMSAISFGSVSVLDGAVVDTTGTITINCTGGLLGTTRNCVSIGAGPGGDATSRVMSDASNTLRFELYSDPARTTKWGSWETGYDTTGVTRDIGINGSASLTVYARVLGSQQNTPPGSYTASFTANPFDRYATTLLGQPPPCPVSSNQTTSTLFTVSATVAAACSVSVSNLAFGAKGLLSSITDATSSITVQCTNATSYTIALDGGTTAAIDPTQRKMSKAAEQITYGIYRDSMHAQPWGSNTGVNTAAGTGTGTVQSITAYGRVPTQATPSPGVYTDTIVVTVTY